ncbi:MULTISPECIES: citramalate synthase [Clostridium]|uniref:Citramalate synthase n=1 Tax=Clostridium cibarium TaxID=2762247 RepID=A0ABR8PUZ4_9CLOT|nr:MULTISPECIES: citramalate synthase [Clostridium]MBD7911991.1 citramalate synthase [Clostridium cibarium]
MTNKNISIFDSTLRDGAQGQGISFSLEDKLKIVRALDDIGVTYIEAGNPGSNPKDMEFFKRIKEVKLNRAKIAAFGSTRRSNIKAEDDKNIKNLLSADTDVVVVFGKSWDFQVTEILKTTLDENLNMISDTIKYLIDKGKEVIFDAEHFFDGYKDNNEYALSTIKVAEKAGASTVVLCDTNGGTLPNEVKDIASEAISNIGGNVGIHCHDDIGMAVANSIVAAQVGINHIQGTFIGMGERCGNANLSAIIPTLKLKMGHEIIDDQNLSKLTSVARFIAEISNITLKDETPYVGNSAFAHKGGMHIDAVCKDSKSYEHIIPESVGNKRRFLISEVSGKSTILSEIQKIFPQISKESKEVQIITDRLKELEYEGYQFEGAEGTVELVMRKIIGKYKPFFKLNHFKVFAEQPSDNGEFTSSVMINVTVDGKEEMNAAEGEGPVNALDKALRKALEVFYPQLKDVRLVDYKVRVLDSESATEAKVRVLIESTDGVENWSTVGVSRDIIQASWIALVDSIEYKLIKDIERKVKTYF